MFKNTNHIIELLSHNIAYIFSTKVNTICFFFAHTHTPTQITHPFYNQNSLNKHALIPIMINLLLYVFQHLIEYFLEEKNIFYKIFENPCSTLPTYTHWY